MKVNTKKTAAGSAPAAAYLPEDDELAGFEQPAAAEPLEAEAEPAAVAAPGALGGVSRGRRRAAAAPRTPIGYRVQGTVRYVPAGADEPVDARHGDVLTDLPDGEVVHLMQQHAIEPIWE
jgi:hypothetical protein